MREIPMTTAVRERHRRVQLRICQLALLLTISLIGHCDVAWSQHHKKGVTIDRYVWLAVLPNDSCQIDDQPAVPCGRVTEVLRSLPVEGSHVGITMRIDDAKYETVALTMDALRNGGFSNLDVFPPMMGEIPSQHIRRWIRYLLAGERNHIPPTVTITMESFKAWSEADLQVVVTPAEYQLIQSLTKDRIGRGDCLLDFNTLRYPNYSILVLEHDGGITHSCVLPGPTDACLYLRTVTAIHGLNLNSSDVRNIGHLAGEIPCELSDRT
jgi:hypothetical protein